MAEVLPPNNNHGDSEEEEQPISKTRTVLTFLGGMAFMLEYFNGFLTLYSVSQKTFESYEKRNETIPWTEETSFQLQYALKMFVGAAELIMAYKSEIGQKLWKAMIKAMKRNQADSDGQEEDVETPENMETGTNMLVNATEEDRNFSIWDIHINMLLRLNNRLDMQSRMGNLEDVVRDNVNAVYDTYNNNCTILSKTIVEEDDTIEEEGSWERPATHSSREQPTSRLGLKAFRRFIRGKMGHRDIVE